MHFSCFNNVSVKKLTNVMILISICMFKSILTGHRLINVDR